MRKSALVVFAALSLPLAASAQGEVRYGRGLYNVYCASCHGADARGNGWLAQYLTRRPPPLTLLAKDFGGSFPRELVREVIDGRREVVLHGPREMPVWGDRLRGALGPRPSVEAAVQRRINAITDYLAGIQE